MRRLSFLLVLLPSVVSAQAHPRAVFNASIVTRVQAKAAGADAAWVAMRGNSSGPAFSCDYVTRTTAGTPDSLPPVYAPWEPVTSSPPGTVTHGYQGGDFNTVLMNLAVCYQGLKDSDPAQAAKYAAQAKKIVLKASAPFASVAPASPPTAWGTVTSRMAGPSSTGGGAVTNTGPGGQARVTLYYHGLVTGATVTISGVTGCTTANITGKVGATTQLSFDLNNSGGTAVICNAAGTNYNWNILNDAGYGVRFFVPILALGYDWFTAEFSAGEKTQIFASINAMLDEAKRYSYNHGVPGAEWDAATQNNYHAGYFTALALAGICTRGGGENSRGQEWYDYWHDTIWASIDKPFYDKWLDNNASYPDAVQYLGLAVGNMALVAWSQYTANAENLFGAGGDWPWLLENMKWFVHSTTPPRTYYSQRGLIYFNNDGKPPNPWDYPVSALWAIHHLADVAADSFRPKFKQWIDDLTTINNPATSWWKVVFYDAALSSSDWTTEPLNSPQGSNPAGGYGRLMMRSDWTTGAVFGDLLGGPRTEGYGSKARRDKGTLLVQRANVHLLSTPFTEVVNAGNSGILTPSVANAAWGYFDGAQYTAHPLWYVTKVGDANPIIPLNNTGVEPEYDRPFATPPVVATSRPQRIDRFEDATSYVYARNVRMDENYYRTNSGWRPTVGWDREVLYLRPKVFVIYDRTNKLNKATNPVETFTQKMTFNVGKTPTTAAYGSGMFRSEVSTGGTYKGALTYVLPAGMSQPSSSDLGAYGIVYQMAVAPPSETQYVNWLTVADAADAQANLASIAIFATRSNVDVIRVGTDTVVGFTSQQNGASAAFPLTYTMSGMGAGVTHYLCGLAASTTYKRTVSGNDVTIATSGGGTDTASTAAGCITFTSGSVANPPVVVGTSSPMPGGTVGVAYSQCLSASGGDGGPYTYALDSGSVPAGTSLTAGCIAGTPTTATTYNFAITANDGADTSVPKSLSITIAANPVNITTTTLPNGVVDQAYAQQLCASGGTQPYVWDTTPDTGSLPTGLSITNGSPCATLTGTPTITGTYTFTVDLADNIAQTDVQSYSLQVATATLTNLTVNVIHGSNSAQVVFGGSGIPSGTQCLVQILQADIVVKQSDELLRLAKQRATFSGLSPETTYGALVTCPNSSGPGVISFTTVPLEAVSPVTIPIVLKPNGYLGTVTQVTLDWGVDSLSENTTTVSCASGCTINLSLSAGIYISQYTWKTAGGVAVSRSSIKEIIVP